MKALNEIGKELEKYWKFWDVHGSWKEWKLIDKVVGADGSVNDQT